jgi:hypothetical protein
MEINAPFWGGGQSRFWLIASHQVWKANFGQSSQVMDVEATTRSSLNCFRKAVRHLVVKSIQVMFKISAVTLDHCSLMHRVFLDGDRKPAESNGAIGEKDT